jgi:hypothetical protein
LPKAEVAMISFQAGTTVSSVMGLFCHEPIVLIMARSLKGLFPSCQQFPTAEEFSACLLHFSERFCHDRL